MKLSAMDIIMGTIFIFITGYIFGMGYNYSYEALSQQIVNFQSGQEYQPTEMNNSISVMAEECR